MALVDGLPVSHAFQTVSLKALSVHGEHRARHPTLTTPVTILFAFIAFPRLEASLANRL